MSLETENENERMAGKMKMRAFFMLAAGKCVAYMGAKKMS